MSMIQFEQCAVEDVKKSAKTGKACYEDGVMAIITIDSKTNLKISFAAPRNKESDNDFIARLPLELRKNWAKEVLAYCKGKKFCDGTPLQNMTWLGAGQIETLRSAGISSVEALAKVTNGVLEPFGLDGMDLSRKAKAWLEDQSGHAVAIIHEQSEKLDALKSENIEMKQALAAMKMQLEAMQMTQKKKKAS